MDRRDGDPPIAGRVDLLGVKAGRLLEETGERRVLVVLVVRLGCAAQRAQILEHPFGVAAVVGPPNVGVGNARTGIVPNEWRRSWNLSSRSPAARWAAL